MRPEDWGPLTACIVVVAIAALAGIGLVVVVRWVAHLF